MFSTGRVDAGGGDSGSGASQLSATMATANDDSTAILTRRRIPTEYMAASVVIAGPRRRSHAGCLAFAQVISATSADVAHC